jgi:hypothetical protein
MKLPIELPEKNSAAHIPKSFRRLKWNELVSPGDFIADEHQGLEPWQGPSGFQADSFLQPIYRARKAPTA